MTAMDDRARPRRWPIAIAAVAGAVVALNLLGAAPTLAKRSTAPSFSREVAPILANRCTSCHQLGGIAPFSLQSAAAAHLEASAIGQAVSTRRMPPWPPGRASPALVGSDLRTLTPRERDVLVRWALAGGPVDRAVRVGKPAPADETPLPGETGRSLQLPSRYTPVETGGATDDYHCFLLDPQLDADVYVTSARIDPGARSEVHHVILFKVPPSQVAEAEQLDARTPEEGWSCFGGTGLDISQGGGVKGALDALDDAPWLAAWAPGAAGNRLPAGLGIPLAKGSRIVMQVHYNLLNGDRPDRSSAVLTTVPAAAGPLTPVEAMLLPAPIELPCPAAARGPLCSRTAAIDGVVKKYGAQAAYTVAGLDLLCGRDAANPTAGPTTTCDRRIDRPTTILGVGGHMHLLGRSIRVELNPGRSDARVLLDIPRWNFHWQGLYRLVQPVSAQPGDVVRVTCRHDQALRKTAGHGVPRTPRYVVWGEGTTDEMCLAVLQVVRS